MSLRNDRVQFTLASCQLIVWINEANWSFGKVECFEAEGFVYLERHVKVGVDKVVARDNVHKSDSRHYQGLAKDLCIFINGEYITAGDHPIWKLIDKKAQEINPKLSLGIEFHDANHLSWAEGDQK